MLLKNKKTGELATLTLSSDGETLILMNERAYVHSVKLKDLEEWEDVPEEEPKEYWYMSNKGDVRVIDDEDTDWDNERKLIGNYFETKEEAELAVRKLKAWKRLKDKGFRFGHFVTYGEDGCGKVVFKCDEIKLGYENAKEFYEDIVLLFEGEE